MCSNNIFPRRSQPDGARNQAEALRAEGVVVTANAMGELSIDFEEYGWFPEMLPSEEAEEALATQES